MSRPREDLFLWCSGPPEAVRSTEILGIVPSRRTIPSFHRLMVHLPKLLKVLDASSWRTWAAAINSSISALGLYSRVYPPIADLLRPKLAVLRCLAIRESEWRIDGDPHGNLNVFKENPCESQGSGFLP